jgi:hypothetical protein
MNRAEIFSDARMTHPQDALKFSALYNILGRRSSFHKLTKGKSVSDIILRGEGLNKISIFIFTLYKYYVKFNLQKK